MTETTHDPAACGACAEALDAAEGVARATGSVAATYGDDQHKATWRRPSPPESLNPPRYVGRTVTVRVGAVELRLRVIGQQGARLIGLTENEADRIVFWTTDVVAEDAVR